MKKFLHGSVAFLALAALLVACGRKDSTKYLVMGTDAKFPPFEMRAGGDGSEIVGFDVEVARAIAAKAGLPLKIVEMDFDRLLPALGGGKVDLVLAGMTITSERAEKADFSSPYYRVTQVALVLAGGPVPQSKDDLKGMRIAVQLGTTGDGAATKIAGPENVRQFASAPEAIAELMNAKADCVLIDEQPAIQFAKENPELMLARLNFDEEFYGVAVRKGHAELLAKVNETLAEIASDGRYEQYVERWLVRTPETEAAEDAEAAE